jgi:hypothetical protein
MNDLQRALLEVLVLDVHETPDDYEYCEAKPPQGDDPARHQIAWAYITRGTVPGEIDAEITNIHRQEHARWDAMRRQRDADRHTPAPVVVPQDVRDQVTAALAQAREYLTKFASSTMSATIRRQLHGANGIVSQSYRADTWTLDRQVRVSNAIATAIDYIGICTQAPTIRDSVIRELRTAQVMLRSTEWESSEPAAT